MSIRNRLAVTASIANGIIILACVWKIDLDQGTYADAHYTSIPMSWAEIVLPVLGIASIVCGIYLFIKQRRANRK